ncbi:hypothetical protein TTHERM_00274580 (macronuclear) [Tetrahymena thermophila SB210]|uniref:Uncharacterized protein n=1 Tax=Tetrahymena thermophila (strain SB210) TaxID=312017 RepID=I7LUR5_TETTS|nr:hypothetical protein TTHERM_00274580 [Tetrahymena thermophila SB210]EAR95753.2 hypothetical protein TTHERM_00274580 [Tetrahymena thermophila SB210]|eukprot:XP_001015998.2 hypothetical protein TTHERM_00274580 [Tetrahymena thermophila SB210]
MKILNLSYSLQLKNYYLQQKKKFQIITIYLEMQLFTEINKFYKSKRLNYIFYRAQSNIFRVIFLNHLNNLHCVQKKVLIMIPLQERNHYFIQTTQLNTQKNHHNKFQ